MGCASGTQAASASEQLESELEAYEAKLRMLEESSLFLALDDTTRVSAPLYHRLRREGARRRDGAHALIFDEKGMQRLRRPQTSASGLSAFAMGEAVRVVGLLSLGEALGSGVVGSVRSICSVEDGRYRLSGLSGRCFEEVELEAYEDDRVTASAKSPRASTPATCDDQSTAPSECSSGWRSAKGVVRLSL